MITMYESATAHISISKKSSEKRERNKIKKKEEEKTDMESNI